MEPPNLELAGRWLIVAFFLIAGLYNMNPARIRDHVERMRGFGVPLPAAAFWFGIFLQFAGCAMLIFDWQARLGAIFLIVFTAVAGAIFHRFWNADEPMRRNQLRIALLNNIAVIGGLLVLLSRLN